MRVCWEQPRPGLRIGVAFAKSPGASEAGRSGPGRRRASRHDSPRDLRLPLGFGVQQPPGLGLDHARLFGPVDRPRERERPVLRLAGLDHRPAKLDVGLAGRPGAWQGTAGPEPAAPRRRVLADGSPGEGRQGRIQTPAG